MFDRDSRFEAAQQSGGLVVSDHAPSISHSSLVLQVAEQFLPGIGQKTKNYGRTESGLGVMGTLIANGAVRYISRRKDDYHKYDLKNLRTWNTTKLLYFLIEYFPEMAKTIDTYLKVGDTDFVLKVFKPNHSPSQAGQEALKSNIQRINTRGVTLPGYNKFKGFRPFLREQLFNVLLGAACCESVFAEESLERGTLKPRTVTKLRHEYFESVNPMTINFDYDGIPWQTTSTYGTDNKLDIPNFFYEQNTFFPGYPYGRNQLVSVIRPALFKMELMDDIKRAVHNQGHPRIKVEIDDQAIIAAAQALDPDSVRTAEAQAAFVKSMLETVAQYASELEPDSCIATLASQKWTYLEMQHTGAGMFNPEKLIEQIDTQITSSLQTFPTILGKSFAGNTEGYSSIESLLYLIWVIGNQNIICDMMARALTQILHKEHGMTGYVTCNFKQPKLRQSEEMAGFKLNELNNIKMAFISGSINEDEMTRAVRECLSFDGDRPDDAEMIREAFLEIKKKTSESGSGTDPSKQPAKEEKRKETNNKNKTGG